MRKLVLVFVFMFCFAKADFLHLEFGGGVWNSSPSGYIVDSDIKSKLKDDIGLKTKASPYFWILFKHPIILVPNLRVEYLDLNYKSKVPADKIFVLDKNTFKEGSNVEFSFKQTDFIFYYNLLDNTFWLTLDLGLDIKVYKAYVKASSSNLNSKINLNFALPFAYARSRTQLPFMDLGFEVEGKYLSYKGSNFYDALAKIDYVFSEGSLDLGLELGYKKQKIKIVSDKFKNKNLKTDISFSGPFLGLFAKF